MKLKWLKANVPSKQNKIGGRRTDRPGSLGIFSSCEPWRGQLDIGWGVEHGIQIESDGRRAGQPSRQVPVAEAKSVAETSQVGRRHGRRRGMPLADVTPACQLEYKVVLVDVGRPWCSLAACNRLLYPATYNGTSSFEFVGRRVIEVESRLAASVGRSVGRVAEGPGI